ncbi:MAG: hypothetical protein AAF431_14005 [Pseudomonadota bacterium]
MNLLIALILAILSVHLWKTSRSESKRVPRLLAAVAAGVLSLASLLYIMGALKAIVIWLAILSIAGVCLVLMQKQN